MDATAKRVARRWISGHKHPEVPVLVNKSIGGRVLKVETMVDQGVAGVVEALSQIPEIETKGSCQGDPGSYLTIRFIYRKEARVLLRFMNRLAELPGVNVIGLPYGGDQLAVFMKAANGDIEGLAKDITNIIRLEHLETSS